MAPFRLVLYVSRYSRVAGLAAANACALLDGLPEPCELLLVDVESRPDLAAAANIAVTPTLEFQAAGRRGRVFGDLGDGGWLRGMIEAESHAPAR